jgi:hypothetical protein
VPGIFEESVWFAHVSGSIFSGWNVC